ncbi:MAG: preprotein translocase subunit YajC [Actinomycetota bacterium]|nr:preprotein translocase subunit YajC [Actinomycetota bacterium]
MGPLLALLITFGLMWALLILPQQRKMRRHQAVVASLEVGDEVVTAGGVYGTVVGVAEETLSVEVAPGIVLQVLRNAVTQRVAPAETVVDDDPAPEPADRAAVDRAATDGVAVDMEDEI